MMKVIYVHMYQYNIPDQFFVCIVIHMYESIYSFFKCNQYYLPYYIL